MEFSMHFARYNHISGNWRMPPRHRILRIINQYPIWNFADLFYKFLWLYPQRSIWQTAFQSGSQPPGLSVCARLLWSPLQRFIFLKFGDILVRWCQDIFSITYEITYEISSFCTETLFSYISWSYLELHQLSEQIFQIFNARIFRVTRCTCICVSWLCKELQIFFF